MVKKRTFTDANAVRAALMRAMRLDLFGPEADNLDDADYAEEILPAEPSRWYLGGFLVPYEAGFEDRCDPTGDEDIDAAFERDEQLDDASTPERPTKRVGAFPSSAGLSVLLSDVTASLHVKVDWATYRLGQPGDLDHLENVDDETLKSSWLREAHQASLELPIRLDTPMTSVAVPDSDGLELTVTVRALDERVYPDQRGLSVSLFLVNQKMPASENPKDGAYIFQPKLTVECAEGFLPRPDLRGEVTKDHDERIADLQYRDEREWCVGHNISVMAQEADGRCHVVETTWLPTASVEKMAATQVTGVEVGMEALAEAKDFKELETMLMPMVGAYRQWIATQRAVSSSLSETRQEILAELMEEAAAVASRIEGGIQALQEPLVREAFQLANQAVARAIRQRLCHNQSEQSPDAQRAPSWRPFQLGFVLMNLVAMDEPAHQDRSTVDLLFFPTGGGKTEAYLGLAAYTMVLRRLKDPSLRSAGLTVLMRYTLRLLTLDQLGRAATLVCALELKRQEMPERLGEWPFEIGLWVGQSATPNVFGSKGDSGQHTLRYKLNQFRRAPDRNPSPIPLETCPWCGTKFNKDTFALLPDDNHPKEMAIHCANRRCDFIARKQPRGLPLCTVDEEIYRRLPAFMIATVDKFANVPWVGPTGGFFGRITSTNKDGFYGPGSLEQPSNAGRLSGLLPPELVIQDELHLISGPLGTMVGLYETVLEQLSMHDMEGQKIAPKIVASTATVRRAEAQIQALFARSKVHIFPPQGPDRRDTFFAEVVPVEAANPRIYMGIGAAGRNHKVVLMRVYQALLSGAQRLYKECGGKRNKDNPVDPYMTLLGYFGSLRELGGSRRIVEDEIGARLAEFEKRRQRLFPEESLMADRPKLGQPEELTSRESTAKVAETKRRLELPYHEDNSLSVALATNMISVGLDITRLGLMVVLGQPKSAAEYIQSTSRVGRDDKRPGLVITLLNMHRPRDRSHYEGFNAWHRSFYRAVEATSVTPFSLRAVDRGLAGVSVALARHHFARLTPAKGAGYIQDEAAVETFISDILIKRMRAHEDNTDPVLLAALTQTLRRRVHDLIEAWTRISESAGGRLQYQREVGEAAALLHMPTDNEVESLNQDKLKFLANRSLRDVEPTVAIFVDELHQPGGDSRG